MKANELMIGNWIEPHQCRIPTVYARVEGIYPNGITIDKAERVFSFDEIHPIPLTPEILEKNGFKKDEKLEEMYYWNWGIGNNCVSYDKETGIVRIFHVFGHLVFVLPLSYVHELQHALRLCGIEKEIEL